MNNANTLLALPIATSRLTKNHGLRRVVVLGAGVSRTFGLPLASQLFPQMVDWIHQRGEEHRLSPVFQFLEFFYPRFAKSSGWFPPAEDVLGMLDAALLYNALRSGNVGYRWRSGPIEAFRIRFARLLGEYLWSFQKSVSDADLACLRRLVASNGTRTVYVTFNYDLTLETALAAEGIPYSYSLQPGRPSAVSVLKPHGSINWYRRTSHFDATDPRFFALGPELAAGTSHRLAETGRGVSKEPFIIPPTPNKQFTTEELRRTWMAFSVCIASSPEVIAAGYSMPDADRMARIVLNRAGPRHSARRRVRVINPSVEVREAYVNCVSPKCEFVASTFREWVDRELPAP